MQSNPVNMEQTSEDLTLANELPADSFSLLLRAARYAQNADSPPWEFAVTLSELQEQGLGRCDVQWLICKGYLCHGRIVSQPKPKDCAAIQAETCHFSADSVFVLTPDGVQLAKQLLIGSYSESDARGAAADTARHLRFCDYQAPCWDSQRRELRLGRIVIKRFRTPAENQERILSAFQEESWPLRIDDPLPPAPEIDPKRRLHSAIQCLNRNQKSRVMRFHGDGRGSGVQWELLTARSA